jgi:hypothetical protein
MAIKDNQWSIKHYTEKYRLSNINPTKNRECKLIYSGRMSSSSSTCGNRCVTFKQHEHHPIWKSCWTTQKKILTHTKQMGVKTNRTSCLPRIICKKRYLYCCGGLYNRLLLYSIFLFPMGCFCFTTS